MIDEAKNAVERLAYSLRGFAWSRGAPRKEDDEEAALDAARTILASSMPNSVVEEQVASWEKEWLNSSGAHWGDKIDWGTAREIAKRLTALKGSDQ